MERFLYTRTILISNLAIALDCPPSYFNLHISSPKPDSPLDYTITITAQNPHQSGTQVVLRHSGKLPAHLASYEEGETKLLAVLTCHTAMLEKINKGASRLAEEKLQERRNEGAIFEFTGGSRLRDMR